MHAVPAVGFAVDGGTDEATGQPRGWWVCTGDTGPNPVLWQRLRMKVTHLVIETAFSAVSHTTNLRLFGSSWKVRTVKGATST